MRIIAVVLWLALAGCATAPYAPTPSPMDAMVEQLRVEGRLPGVAVAAVKNGEVVYAGAFGVASLEHGAKVTPDTVFETASVTKQMTALAVMALVAEGRVSLTDPIGKYVEGAPEAWRRITVDMLLTHMAGLDHHFEPSVDGVHLLENSTARMLAAAKATPMKEAPVQGFNYSDQGYFLLGLVIERATGVSYGEHMQRRFFGPLQMTSTSLLDQRAVIPQCADGYRLKDGKLERNRRVWQFDLTSHFGVLSSLNDMIRWEQGLASETAAAKALQAQTWEIRRQFEPEPVCSGFGYGRGWWVREASGRRYVEHAGFTGTNYLRDVTSGLSVIVLSNRDQPDDAVAQRIAWRVANAIDAGIPPAQPEC